MGEMYVLATVTDDTNPNLEYGAYRGLVVLDPDGVCVEQVDSMAAAQEVVGTALGIAPADLDLEDVEACLFYGDYGRCWNVVGPYRAEDPT